MLVYDETLRRGRSKKLKSKWIEPYEIIAKVTDVTYAIKTKRRTQIVHVNKLKAFVLVEH